MAAANTDKLRKISKRWVGQIGSGGVADDTVTTIPLSSTTNLPTTTAVTLVIDRVDANGTATPTLEETIVGVVSGTNIINASRAVEGTAQAHTAGAVVELLWSADNWNDAVDWGLVEHLQDGTHASITASAITLAGSTLVSSCLDEDTMSSNSATAIATQQSIKAYADTKSSADKTETLTNKTLTSPVIDTGFSGTAKAAGTDIATGTADTKIVTPKAMIDAGTYRHIGTITDFNAALSQGQYKANNVSTNAPSASTYGILRCMVSDGTTHNNSTNWIYQECWNTTGEFWTRGKVNNGAWTAWVKRW